MSIKIENQVTATFRIVTPMFLGGADQQADEIRPSSVKGMLRFWWRALNWSRYRSQPGATDASALKELNEEESNLFGSAAKTEDGKQVGGQGIFLLSVQGKEIKIGKPVINRFSELHYMAGQGVVFQKDANKDRNAILSGEFALRLRFRDIASHEQRVSVVEAVRLFGLLGGMGSRSRRGFGSVSLIEMKGVVSNPLPETMEEYKQAVGQFLVADGLRAEPPLTAFSHMGQVVFCQLENTSLKVIETIGKEMGFYRGFGNNGNTFGQKAEQNFKADHDEMFKAAQGQSVNQHPKRLVFGMPHNYFFSSLKKSAQIQKTKGKLERRASPLMVHVHPVGDKYIGVLLMMRSTFLPAGESVVVGRSEVPVAVDWKVIETFMQRPAFTQGDKA